MSAPDKASIAISQSLQPMADAIESVLDRAAGEHVGFALLVFKMGDPAVHGQRAQYVSNVDRPTMIKALEELLECWKAGEVRGPVGMPDLDRH